MHEQLVGINSLLSACSLWILSIRLRQSELACATCVLALRRVSSPELPSRTDCGLLAVSAWLGWIYCLYDLSSLLCLSYFSNSVKWILQFSFLRSFETRTFSFLEACEPFSKDTHWIQFFGGSPFSSLAIRLVMISFFFLPWITLSSTFSKYSFYCDFDV